MIADIIIIAIVALVFGYCLKKFLAELKSGKCDGCGGNCSGCHFDCHQTSAKR